jgi:uncharacterized membrane protein YfcA
MPVRTAALVWWRHRRVIRHDDRDRRVSLLEALAIVAAGIAAGIINTVVGSGTLITFPALLAVGYPPVLANVTNTVGLTPGSVAGALGYRRELAGQRRRLVVLGAVSVVGGLVGGLLLLVLPAAAFRAIVPILIGLACVLVVLQPRLSRRVAARREARQAQSPSRRAHRDGGPLLQVGVLGSGMYGGYFGAAQGVLLLALLGVFLDEDLQRINAAKNVFAGLVNATAALLFIVVADVAWAAAGLIAIGATVGGLLGARIGRRLPPAVLRVVIVVIGVVAIVRILAG